MTVDPSKAHMRHKTGCDGSQTKLRMTVVEPFLRPRPLIYGLEGSSTMKDYKHACKCAM